MYYPPSQTKLPEHIAPIVVYLAGEKGARITGQLFHAAGGEITLYRTSEPHKAIHTQGKWTQEQLADVFPTVFGAELPMPPMPPPP